jgi:TolB-like protein
MSAYARAIGACRWAFLVSLVGCAGGGALRVSDITPQSIPDLEEARARGADDANTLSRLGVAYFKAERFADARQVLDSAVARDGHNGIAAIFLGMATEAMGDFPAARTAYEHYISIARSAELQQTARRRLALVSRHELEFQARQALAQEATLAGMPPDANTIAVMPFSYSGTNQTIQPLTRGLAQLVVTDLAKSRQLRVLERERMQAILSEMRLADSGGADPQTALRSGRLLRASRVVQGTIAERGTDLRVDAAVVDVQTAGVAGSAGASDALARLFDLEKQVVFSIFNSLGIQLSDQERAAIEQRPTQNVQAFLAYSRGLEAEDRGDFDGARAAFGEAARLDPSFRAAVQGASSANDLSLAAQQTTAQVEALVVQNQVAESGAGVTEDARLGALLQAADGIAPTLTAQVNTEQTQSQSQAPDRQPTAETTNTQGPVPPPGAMVGTVVIVIRRPQ